MDDRDIHGLNCSATSRENDAKTEITDQSNKFSGKKELNCTYFQFKIAGQEDPLGHNQILNSYN